MRVSRSIESDILIASIDLLQSPLDSRHEKILRPFRSYRSIGHDNTVKEPSRLSHCYLREKCFDIWIFIKMQTNVRL